MTERNRPYIPLSVRVKVAERHLCERVLAQPGIVTKYLSRARMAKSGIALKIALRILRFKKPQLDHDPALILREFNKRTGKYTPDANDPAHLIYREKAEHQQKTTGRKPGASRTITTKGSDIGLKSKFARLEGKTKPKRKMPIKSRGFPKGGPKQKIPQRKNSWR